MKTKIKFLILIICIVLLNTNVYAVTTDTKGPILNDISIKDGNGEKYSVGDKIYLNLDVYDDVSGIDKIWIRPKAESNTRLTKGLLVEYDENNEPYVVLSSEHYNGVYYFDEITLYDKNENWSEYRVRNYLKDGEFSYQYSPYPGAPLIDVPLIERVIYYEVINGKEEPNLDKKTLIIESISADKTDVKYGETITFTAKIKDFDYTNASISLGLSSETSGRVVRLEHLKDDIYVGHFVPSNGAGKWRINYVTTSNNIFHFLKSSEKSECEDETGDNSNSICILGEIEFNVIEDLDYLKELEEQKNKEYVKIKEVKVNKENFLIPSYIDAEVTVDTNLNIKSLGITFISKDGAEVYNDLQNSGNNIFKGSIELNQYLSVGEYELYSISVETTNGTYKNHYAFFNRNSVYKTDDLNYELKINLTSRFTPDVIVGTETSNLVEVIKNAKDDAIIYIDALNNTIIPKEVFDAIKDTNKEIHIESSGIEWVFNGKDIVNPKQIDVSLHILYSDQYDNLNMVDYTEKSLILKFADNGELPGVATVMIKLDYVFRDYIGQNVYVYYIISSNEGVFENLFNDKISLNNNGYFEFKINHNSEYVFSTEKIKNEFISNSKDLLTLNENNHTTNDVLPYVIIGVVLLVSIVVINILYKKRKIVDIKNNDQSLN